MGRFQYTYTLPGGLRELMVNIKPEILEFFRESLNLQDLGAGGVSGIVRKSKDFRVEDPQASSEIRVIEAKWDESSNTITINFEATPTKGPPTKVITPSGRPYQGTFYNVMFVFGDVNKYLGPKSQFKPTDTQKFKQMLLNAPVKLYSNDPSFYYQGAWEDLAKHDGTVFPFPGPAGDGIWHDRHAQSGGLVDPDIRITKHMTQVIESLDSFVPEILSKLDKKWGAPEPTPGVTTGVKPVVNPAQPTTRPANVSPALGNDEEPEEPGATEPPEPEVPEPTQEPILAPEEPTPEGEQEAPEPGTAVQPGITQEPTPEEAPVTPEQKDAEEAIAPPDTTPPQVSPRSIVTVPGAEAGKVYRVQGPSGQIQWIKARDRNQARYAYSKATGDKYVNSNAWRDDEGVTDTDIDSAVVDNTGPEVEPTDTSLKPQQEKRERELFAFFEHFTRHRK